LSSRVGVNEPKGTEDDIHRAMVQLIEKASHFIYIENQFFVSSFGQIGGDTGQLSPAAQYINTYGGADQNKTARLMGAADDHGHIKVGRKGLKPTVSIDDSDLHNPPTNKVCEALIKRITRAILDAHRPNFHVYITLPVHPEGCLNKASIAVQVYWTMQTIAFGSKSLLNGIRRAIKVRELMDKDDSQHICRDHSEILDDEANREYESVPVEACFKYVTLLNLRNWAKLGEGMGVRYVTEQVYVHSKLMIVDDLYALFGSANINDRSLLGERDSEIAVLVMDGETSRADVNGKGSQRPVRKFAHQLRMEVWQKLFGITGGVRPATDLQSAIDAPGSPDSWKRIQAQAASNAAAYEAAFDFVPRNWSGELDKKTNERLPARILPTWKNLANAPANSSWGALGNIGSPMPFQSEFWSAPRHDPSRVDELDKIRGFITALPIHWTKNENVKFDYPTSLVAGNEPQNSVAPKHAEQTARIERNEVDQDSDTKQGNA
jgi:phospholipase D1/2